jgi:hypothetical protein
MKTKVTLTSLLIHFLRSKYRAENSTSFSILSFSRLEKGRYIPGLFVKDVIRLLFFKAFLDTIQDLL